MMMYQKKFYLFLRKLYQQKMGLHLLANVTGFEVGGKTGTAQKSINGVYTNKKINSFYLYFQRRNRNSLWL